MSQQVKTMELEDYIFTIVFHKEANRDPFEVVGCFNWSGKCVTEGVIRYDNDTEDNKGVKKQLAPTVGARGQMLVRVVVFSIGVPAAGVEGGGGGRGGGGGGGGGGLTCSRLIQPIHPSIHSAAAAAAMVDSHHSSSTRFTGWPASCRRPIRGLVGAVGKTNKTMGGGKQSGVSSQLICLQVARLGYK